MTFLRLGLGRLAVSWALAAEPAREGRSTDFMPPPILDGPKEDIFLKVYADGFFWSRVAAVSSQMTQGSSMDPPLTG
jgi:hypothetical protein